MSKTIEVTELGTDQEYVIPLSSVSHGETEPGGSLTWFAVLVLTSGKRIRVADVPSRATAFSLIRQVMDRFND